LLSLSLFKALCTSQQQAIMLSFRSKSSPSLIGNYYIVYGGWCSSCQLNKLIFIGCQIDCSFESWFVISCIRCTNGMGQLIYLFHFLKYNNNILYFSILEMITTVVCYLTSWINKLFSSRLLYAFIKTKYHHITNIINTVFILGILFHNFYRSKNRALTV